jgi:hypothetical protein
MFSQDESKQQQSRGGIGTLPDMMNEMPSKSRKKKSMPSSQLFDDDSRSLGSNMISKKGGGG